MSAETPPYFYYPFGIDGDLTAIPITTQPSGAISYQQGYGPDYELDLLTNPDAIPIGRTTMNQLFFDITTLLQQYSQYGVPLFITTSQNQGVPFPYPIFARVYYGGLVYENQVAANIVLPGTDDTWLVISGDVTGVLPGVILDFAGFEAPPGYLLTDGSAVSRVTYERLMGAITQTQTGTTTNTMDTVSGLTSTAQMYVGMSLESANFPPGTTVLTIVDANNITTSANATAGGSVAIQFFNWGAGDGSTTFNIPDFRRKVSIGSGGSPSPAPGVNGVVVGQFGGEESHVQLVSELATHDHSITTSEGNAFYTGPGSGNALGGAGSVVLSAATIGDTGSNTPFNVMQPSVIVYKIIKI